MPLYCKNFAGYGTISGVWKISENEDFFLENLKLSNYDQHKLGKIGNSKRRLEFLAVRMLAKKIGLCTDIKYADSGKPIIENGELSISHSGIFAAIIFHSNISCSVDIEKVSNRLTVSGKIVLNDYEIAFANNDTKTLTLLWACKECIYKIANNAEIDFKQNIFINRGSIDNVMKGKLKTLKGICEYTLHFIEIEDYILVWL